MQLDAVDAPFRREQVPILAILFLTTIRYSLIVALARVEVSECQCFVKRLLRDDEVQYYCSTHGNIAIDE